MISFSSISLPTERLILRPFEHSDAEAIFKLNSDPDVLRWTTWQPLRSKDEARAWIDSVHENQYGKYGYGRLAVTLRETGELIGWSGVKFAEEYNAPTLGYRFSKEHWGKGYGTEAAKVSLLHAFHTIGLEDVHAWIFSENLPSRRVLEKSGFSGSGMSLPAKPMSRFSAWKEPDISFQSPPIFTSERLAFYELTERDAETMYALNSDVEVVQYTGDPPFESISATVKFMSERAEVNRRHGYGRWKIISRETGECFGWCGLKFHEGKNITDLGYRLFRRHWGKGIATEAAKAALEYGFQNLRLEKIVAHARKENLASLNVLKKCGMEIIGEDKECGGEIFVFEKKLTT